jgi:hypothetical protein
MSENNKPMELSTDELDTVAGGAALSVVDADNLNADSFNFGQTSIGANGGINSTVIQKDSLSQQQLKEIKVADVTLPGVPEGFFS